MSSNLRQPSRIAAYTAEGSYYPRELVEVNGELYLINTDGTRTRVNPAEITTLTDSSGTVIGSIDPTAEDTIELPSASATQYGFVKFSTTAPKANGTAAVGTDVTAARSDHVHPAQTTISGNAATATKLKSGNTIALSGGATGTATNFDGSAPITIPVTALDATKLTGVIPLACIPKGAQERIVVTSTDTTRLALTTNDVQNGDVVKVESTGLMYYVADETALGTEAAFEKFAAGAASSVAWANVTDKPTFTAVATSGKYSDLSGLPTIPVATSTAALAAGTAAAGSSADFARADHVHPKQTSVSGNAGTATKLAAGVNIGLSGVTATAQEFDGSTAITIPITEVPVSLVTGLAAIATSGKYSDLSGAPSIPEAASATPKVASGSGAVGTDITWARADHVHPVQTTISGNAATATKLATGVNIGLSGVTATAQKFDGSTAITIPVTAVPASIVTGTLGLSHGGTGATTDREAEYKINANIPESEVAISDTSKLVFKLSSPSATAGTFVYKEASTLSDYLAGTAAPKALGSSASAGTSDKFARIDHVHPAQTTITGNAETATKLASPVNIGLSGVTATAQEFDGTSDISIPVTAVPASIVTGLADVAKTGKYDDLTGAPSIPEASTTTPKANGTASYGSGTTWARADHVHPLQTEISGNAATATKLASGNTIALSGGATGTATNFDGSTAISIPVTALDATKLTGTIPLACIPKGAQERLVIVADDTAKLALTSSSVQAGDVVKVESTGLMYYVKDDSALGSEDAFEAFTAGTASAVAWSNVTDKPTFATVATSGSYNDLSNKPSIPSASSTTPKAASGSGAVGTGTTWARADHVHPVQTSISGNAATADTADKVANNIVVKLNSGSTEGTNLFTYNGSAAKTINITPAAIGAAKASHGTHVTWSTTTPKANGTAAVGSETKVARGDHVHPLQTTISGNAGSADKVNKNLTISLNGGETEGTDLFTFNGSAAKTIDITPSNIGASASGHTHKYAGSASAGGAANSVANSLSIQLNNGTATTFNGSATKTINITPSAIGAAPSHAGVYFITGTGTKAGTWLGSSDDIGEYYDGLTIAYEIPVAGASTTTLNINSLGAKTCYRYGTSKITTQYAVGTVVLLVYSATKGAWYATDYDSNSDTKVTQTVTTTDAEYPLLASTTASATSTATTTTRFASGVTLNPAGKSLTATTFIGALSGNSTSADKVNANLAIKLNSGSTEGTDLFTFNGSAAKTINITPAAIGAAKASHGTHVSFTTTVPKAAGTAAVGSASTVSRSDHVHPTQTISRTYTASIGTTWTGSAAPYTQTISVSGMTASDNPIVDVVLSGTYSTDETALVEYAKIYRITTAANSITVYASEKTESSVSIQLKCVNS